MNIRMLQNFFSVLAGIVIVSFFAPNLDAELIDPSQLSIASNTMGSFDSRFDIDNIIDGSGLDSYHANSAHSFVHDDNSWFSPFGVTFGRIVFDLGAITDLDAVFVWNESDGTGGTGQEIPTIQLEVSETPLGGFQFTSLGAGQLNILPGVDATQDDPITSAALRFEQVSARYVRFTITAGNGGDLVGLREVAFNSIPEPSSILLAIASSHLLLVSRRRET